MKLDGRTPVCQPLYTLDEVLVWHPGEDDHCVSKTPRSPRKLVDGPKTLICHDLKGGYLEDRLVQGCPKSDCYRFYHWQYVDAFVYFSHHFVTIPPPTWTVPAHRHGVKVLGTLITEWDDGKKRCETFLSSEDSYKALADKLVEISAYYGFDGWLVNIENVIEKEGQVQTLQKFVRYLTEQQHKRDPASEVIWYDSVIDTGKLEWQDGLNEKNRMFFDVCDGIFLNYCWKDENLKASKELAVQADRPYDVYVGIDVFGRGCLGDGGFNTCEALSAAYNHRMSVALFANGWVYEKLGKEDFVQNENKFWRCLNDFCFPRCITSIPLVTTFCHGQGQQYWSEGKAIMGPWYNLSVQQPQPSFTSAQFNSEEFSLFSPVMEPYLLEAFTGGNSLKLGGKITKGQSLKFKLFSLDVDVNNYSEGSVEGTALLYVSFTYKPLQNDDSGMCLHLVIDRHSDASPTKTVVVLPASPKDSFHTSPPATESDTDMAVIFAAKVSEVPSQIKNSESNQDQTSWKTSYFQLGEETLKNGRLREVSAVVTSHTQEMKETTLLLGELKVIPFKSIPDSPPVVVFGETVYHDVPPLSQYIEAENNQLDRGSTTEEDNESTKKSDVDGDQNENTTMCSDQVEADSGISNACESDTGNDASNNGTLRAANILGATNTDTVKAPDSETVQTADIHQVSSQDSKTVEETEGNTVHSPDTDKKTDCKTVQSDCTDKEKESNKVLSPCAHTIKCMECFTLQWRMANPALVQYYGVFQYFEHSDNLKLLGLTTLPCFKVTGFELQCTKGKKSESVITPMGDNSALTSGQSEAKFMCIIQPVLITGSAVSLDICKTNIKCETFRIE